ncbi:PstS family phosphate ABC transporter substrate-binding protein [Sutcliffiella cohnii]|uniref:PstS family phosphate ABC transporter substrate-binding protein n=1 Tax=Sutcliffiella cohnii TaxID=33932 RepID=UPI002E242103|nr:substrate-binding domain-containing protein [Sutcliffiella cohnii]
MKFIGALILSFIIGFVGFIVMFITLLSSGKTIHGLFVIAIFLGLIIFANLLIYGQFKKRWTKISFISYIGVLLLLFAINMGHGYYVNSLKIMSTQDVNLEDYEPFKNNNKLAVLDEGASFQLTDNLPKLDGSTALYPIYASFAQAVYPKKEYRFNGGEVVSTQTSGAWAALLKGSRDIIFAPEAPERVLKEAARKDITLIHTPIGKEAFIFFVHKNNPVDNISLEQIQQIYAGDITNWKELGGKNEEIVAFQRPEDSGSQQALQKLMGTKRLMNPPSEQLASGMGGIIELTAEYENRSNALGFSFRFFSQEMVQNGKIKHLAIDGIEPTLENIQNGTYPIVSEFYAITTEQNTNPNIQPFIKWMISTEGQELIKKTGYTPYHN